MKNIYLAQDTLLDREVAFAVLSRSWSWVQLSSRYRRAVIGQSKLPST